MYFLIKNNFPINAAVIETLCLDSLAIKEGKNWLIPYQLHFENSFIRSIEFPHQDRADKFRHNTSENRPKLLFQNQVTFKLCTLTDMYFKDVIFNNSVTFLNNFPIEGFFSDGIVFDNVEFKKNTRIINDYVSQVTTLSFANDQPSKWIRDDIFNRAEKIFSKFFIDPYIGVEVQPAYKATQTCTFYDEAVIYNNNPYYSFDFSAVTFKGRTYVTSLFPDQLRLKYGDKKARDFPEFAIDPPSNVRFPICNMSFNSANFLHTVSFNNQHVNSIDLRDAFFSDTLMLFNTVIKDSLKTNHGFYYTHLSPGLNIILNPSSFNLRGLNINPISIGEVNFPYCKTNPAVSLSSKALQDNVNSFYNKFINDIKLAYNQDHDLITELENRYRHEQLTFNMYYLWNNPSWANIAELFRLGFLESVVGNGYRGGDNFIVSSVLIILFFTLIYYFLFRQSFIAYINAEDQDAKKRPGKDRKQKNDRYDPRDYTKNFLKCFWKSFHIFLTPKFSRTYFSFPNPLFIIVAIEWLIGVFMIILFLIYIAATYPFIRSLLGL